MAVRTRAQRTWQAATVLVVLLAMTLGTMYSQGFAYQGEDGGDGGAAAATEPAAETTTNEGGSGNSDADGGGDNEQSYLMWMIGASGFFGALIALLSFVMVAVIMMNLLQVRRDVLIPQDFVAAFEDKLNNKDVQGAFDIARGDDSLIGRVLTAGMSRLGRGYDSAVEGMEEVGEEESMALEQRLSWLALIGSIAPMMGLLGTVQGMINSFQTIANSATQPKPKDLADGISTALFTTMEGLIVAIPAIVAYTLLRNRVTALLMEASRVSDNLMSRFNTGSGKKAE
ncbi:MAG: MotA/TolQ/ExbB proton channel family protein [Planctomycetaceae bacterium]|nr:MotA/TolQ/ExbB proton channel family protein [Planctomycetaceae bacterium]MCA9045398.1 MotA/TolQ/ExbB proton channel family protein [Planctomycetaceae bacterium]MCB9952858.1 MotA/TolQ/ExbB proton channel family protein [Planctomycetaceae bacterium]